ncbi:MAG: glutamyl-tRNA reductase [Verrucomicrobiae bacterium]|nr:glutamyl-tRNA reductase [Verrucomicrobiae bacterium]
MKIFVAGLSYKTTPVEVREKLAVSRARLQCCGCRLKLRGNLSEVVLLSTCNRVEIYGVSPWIHGRVQQLFQELTNTDFDFTPHLYVKEGAEAAKHLFAVASGLDSMVLGETEITGQVKNAYQAAKDAGLTGKKMNRLFQTACQVVKQIRTNTAIGRGATSVGSVAVELTEKVFDRDLSDKTVMIVGAGKMGEACVKHLAKRGAKTVLVANRSVERAEKLAAEFGGRAVRIEDSAAAMTEADILVSSTGSPGIVLRREDIEKILPARRNRPLVLVDIAVPRDIDPAVAELPNVFLYDIDDLEAVVRENTKNREHELSFCNEIIAGRAAELMSKLESSPGKKRRKPWSCCPAGSWAVWPPERICHEQNIFNEESGAEYVLGFSLEPPGVRRLRDGTN